jgi:hypothetical protein
MREPKELFNRLILLSSSENLSKSALIPLPMR